MDQGKVTGLQPMHIPQQLMLGVVSVEDLMREIWADPRQPMWDARGDRWGQILDREGHRLAPRENSPQRFDLSRGGDLIERNTDPPIVTSSEIDAARPRVIQDLVKRPVTRPDRHRIEEGCRTDIARETAEPLGQHKGQPMHAFGDPPQPLGAVIEGIHAGHDRQEHLGRTDVAGGSFPADVLLSGLQGQAVSRLSRGVPSDADDAAGNLTLVLLFCGQERRMWPSEPQRDPEPLAGPDGDIGSELTGRTQQREGEEIRRDHEQGPRGVSPIGEALIIMDRAIRRRILQQDAEQVQVGEVNAIRRPDMERHPDRLGARLQDRDGLGMAVFRDEKTRTFVPSPTLSLDDPGTHVHRLGRGRGLVQQGRVGQWKARQVSHHGLEVQEGLQAALRNLRLVRCVLRIPPGVFQDISLNDRWNEAVVVAHPDEGTEDLVFVMEGP